MQWGSRAAADCLETRVGERAMHGEKKDGACCSGAEHIRRRMYVEKIAPHAHEMRSVRSVLFVWELMCCFPSAARMYRMPSSSHETHHAGAWLRDPITGPAVAIGMSAAVATSTQVLWAVAGALVLAEGTPTSCPVLSGRSSLAPRPFFVLPRAPPCEEPQQRAAAALGVAASHSIAERKAGQSAALRWRLGRGLRHAPGRAPPNQAAPGWGR